MISAVIALASLRADAVDGNNPPDPPSAPRLLAATDDAPEIITIAPSDEAAHPITWMLHGMCDRPENECGHFVSAAASSFLVCPRATSSCGGGGTQWVGTIGQKKALLAASRTSLEAAFPNRVKTDETTLVGFSQGAFVGMHLGEEGGLSYLVLIGAALEPDVAKLKASGVKRIALAAGDFDGSNATMQKVAKKLDKAGIPTKFYSMGKIGHWLPSDTNDRVSEMLTWVHTPVES